MSAITLNDKRQIVIELSWLLSALTGEQKRELVDSLACEEEIIADVSAQLLTGWTERSSHGRKSCGADAEPSSAIDKARRELASRSGEVANEEIEKLKRSLVWAKANEERYSTAYFAAYHAWRDRDHRTCPAVTDIKYVTEGEYEVVARANGGAS